MYIYIIYMYVYKCMCIHMYIIKLPADKGNICYDSAFHAKMQEVVGMGMTCYHYIRRCGYKGYYMYITFICEVCQLE